MPQLVIGPVIGPVFARSNEEAVTLFYCHVCKLQKFTSSQRQKIINQIENNFFLTSATTLPIYFNKKISIIFNDLMVLYPALFWHTRFYCFK